MLSLNYENINYVMTQILKLSCASFSYVNISYVLALSFDQGLQIVIHPRSPTNVPEPIGTPSGGILHQSDCRLSRQYFINMYIVGGCLVSK